MFNSLYRDINTDALRNSLTDQAYSGGIDFEQSWSNRKYRLNGHITGSYISEEPVVIERIQRSSARYYQRPDADHLKLDPNRNHLGGTYADLMFTSETRNWVTQFRAYQISPGFEVNDMGFQPAARPVIPSW
jgi:hypothetical protein